MQVTFIIQARTDSTRLPNKMTLPFYKGASILELLINKLKTNFPNFPTILATTESKKDDQLKEIAFKNSIATFRGSENDVLKRFIDAAKKYQANHIIRICADNPFLDMQELGNLLSYTQTNTLYDYTSFMVNSIPSIKTHFGFWAECVTLEALTKVQELTQENLYHEHVTNYIYEHPNLFNIHLLNPNSKVIGRNDIRMTLDTEKDFETLSTIYEKLVDKYGNTWGINEVIDFLDGHVSYKSAMREQIDKNSK